MRILIISFHFPPHNTIGAVRVGKTAKYLICAGHDVRVIAAADPTLAATLPLEIAAEHVRYTSWYNINHWPQRVFGALAGRADVEPLGVMAGESIPGFLVRLGRAYQAICNFPDKQVGWYPFAVRQGKALIDTWRPDLIFASAMPYTALLVGRSLAMTYGIPWVAELRDLWSRNHYSRSGPIRKRLDAALERRVLYTASGLVTVSEPLADILRADYQVPVGVVLNGFDPEDFEGLDASPPADGLLQIVYTGRILEGKRDPSPLFEALRSLGKESEDVRVEFYGEQLGVARILAQRYGVGHLVNVFPQIPYRESLVKQKLADVLLLLLWNDAREKGVYTGKLFEYIGAQRPILAVGPKDNVAGRLIVEKQLGYVETQSDALANLLREMLQRKKQAHGIPGLPERGIKVFSRQAQTRVLIDFLETISVLTRNRIRRVVDL